jgi:hypothetical protein
MCSKSLYCLRLLSAKKKPSGVSITFSLTNCQWSMKYSSLPFVISLVLLIMIKYIELKGTTNKVYLDHGFYTQLGLTVAAVFGNMHYFRHSKIYKRATEAMRYNDI